MQDGCKAASVQHHSGLMQHGTSCDLTGERGKASARLRKAVFPVPSAQARQAQPRRSLAGPFHVSSPSLQPQTSATAAATKISADPLTSSSSLLLRWEGPQPVSLEPLAPWPHLRCRQHARRRRGL